MKITNKKAKFNYFILDEYIAGIVLKGTEIKSIRAGKASIVEAFCRIENGQIIIHNMHIAKYDKGSFYNHEELRDRTLLLNKREIMKIDKELKNRGIALIPLSVFINDKGYAKMKIGLCKGKKLYDKREAIKERDLERYG